MFSHLGYFEEFLLLREGCTPQGIGVLELPLELPESQRGRVLGVYGRREFEVKETITLQKASAREEKDERHICPLQLDVIDRALTLWSNPGDVVLSPFAGIGSEGYQSVKMGRKFIGVELKASYYKQARLNLKAAEEEMQTIML